MSRNRERLTSQSVLALVMGALIFTSVGTSPAFADEKIKFTGCLVQGEDDDAGYFLINTSFAPAYPSSASAASTVTPGAIGTSGTFSNIFYWLYDDDDLREHIGHRVEVEGDAKDGPEDGVMALDRKDDWTELTVKSDGRTMKGRVPNSSIVGPETDVKDVKVIVKRVDVDQVKMLAATCAQ